MEKEKDIIEEMPAAVRERVEKSREIAAQLKQDQTETESDPEKALDEGGEAAEETEDSARGEHVDRDDYKERYIRLRNSRDEKAAELKKERENLAKKLEEQARIVRDLEEKFNNAPSDVAYKAPESLREEFGDELAQQFEESVNTFVKPQFDTLQSNVKAVGQTVIDTQKRSVQQTKSEQFKDQQARAFMAATDLIGTDAAKIDKDPAFAEFVRSNRDEVSGKSLQDIYVNAFKAGDPGRMAQVMQIYKDNNRKGSIDIESKVMPRQSFGSDTTAHNQPKIWTRAAIKDAYENNRRGAYTAEEFSAIKREINQAVSEHRIQ